MERDFGYLRSVVAPRDTMYWMYWIINLDETVCNRLRDDVSSVIPHSSTRVLQAPSPAKSILRS
jgi:hypothetical protein